MKNNLKGKLVWFWYGAGHLHSVTFIRWVRTKNNTGREDTNEIGVGAKVSSSFLFEPPIKTRVTKGLKIGQHVLRPYTQVYRTEKAARMIVRPIKRPDVKTLFTKIYNS